MVIKMKENLEYYNEDLHKIGLASREEVHEKGYLHAVIHLWIIDLKNNRVYLQKRALDKDNFPGFYDITCAGHMDPNESPTETMIRETKEEIGLDMTQYPYVFLGTMIEHFTNDNEIAYVFACDIDNPPFQLGHEVSGMYYTHLNEFFDMPINHEFFTLDNHMFIVKNQKICPHNIELFSHYISGLEKKHNSKNKTKT